MPIPAPVFDRHRQRRSTLLFARVCAILVVRSIASLTSSPPLLAQFVLWETLSVPNPFNVTAAVRGVAPAPEVELEGLVGFSGGAGNQFNVRCGGIPVPIFFHNFESGDLRFFSTANP